MSKICEKCANSEIIYTEMNFSAKDFFCNSMAYKRKIRNIHIASGNEYAATITDIELSKVPMSTQKIGNECEFFKAKQDD